MTCMQPIALPYLPGKYKIHVPRTLFDLDFLFIASCQLPRSGPHWMGEVTAS